MGANNWTGGVEPRPEVKTDPNKQGKKEEKEKSMGAGD